jgi:uncharacterized protein (TIGR02099 family)
VERFIVSVARKTAYALAALVILVACFVMTGWLLAPYFDEHRADIEKLASGYLKKPVTIERVRLSWDQYQPVLSLRNVTVLDEKSGKPVIQIEKVSIFFSLLDSLRNLKLMPGGVLISGTELNVHQNAAGEFSVQGFPAINGAQPYQEETKFRDIMGWLFQQSRIILRNIDISYTGYAGLKREVTLYNLSMKNSGSDHTLVGKAVLRQDIPTEVTIAVTMEGTAEAYEQMKANAYLYVSGLSLSQWLKGVVWQAWRIDEGIGSAKIWATWEQASLQRVQSTFQLYDLQLFSQTDKSTHRINRLSGDVGWKKNGNELVVAADSVLINFSDHLWPSTSFYLSATQAADGTLAPKTIKIGYLDLNDVESFLFSSPAVIPDAAKQALMGTKLNGVLQQAAITFNQGISDWQHTSVHAEFNHLSVDPWQKYPGIENLSGVAKWNGVKGDLLIKSNSLEFKHDTVFANTVNLDQVTGNITVSENNNIWQIATTNLQLLNKDLMANITGSVSIPANGELEADIVANFSIMSAKHITRYLPLKIFGPTLIEWLQEAFFAGKVNAGKAQLKGKFRDFPFDQGNGIFSITGEVANVDFRFAPDWPRLTQVSGKIAFSGNRMSVDVNQGWMMDIPITNAHAEIPYLGDAKPNMLYVKSENIKSDMAAGMAFIHASPLEKNIGRMFEGIAMDGPISLSLGLTMPLANPDKIQVQGDLDIDNIDMKLVPWDLRIDKLTGKVHFTEKSTSSLPLKGSMFNKPVIIQLETVAPKNGTPSFVRANINNHMDISDIDNWLKLPLSKVASGDADIKASIDLAFDAPLVVRLNSNLQGIALDLPDQYAKQANVARQFNADFTVQEGKPLRAKMSYGDLLSAALILDRKNQEFKLTSANLRLGGGDPSWPESAGIYITGTLESLNWDKIKSYLDQSASSKSALTGYTLKAINVLINKLDVFGQHLTAAQVAVIPSAKSWQINLTTPQIKGSITTPVEFSHAGIINAQFDRLSLQTSTEKQTFPINFKTLPAISLDASDVSYNNMHLGQITLKTRATNNGQTIETLRISSRNVDLRAAGNWMAAGKGYKTSMKGTVDSEHVSDFLNALGVDAHNLIAHKGHMNFDLSWSDALYAPDIATLNGRFSIDLGAGRIVDVGESGGAKMDLGKMLSIFSLQTIPRRLSFDFSDIFQKGYSFDFLRGDYTLNNGNVFTENMHIEGPVAKVAIDGRIGLSKKDVNFIMNVTPYVTSSLPIAAGLITANPLIGLGALAVNTVIGSQVSKVVTYRYEVRGPWSNPSWQQANVPSSGR